MYDKPIWGVKPLRLLYSDAAVQVLMVALPERRKRFKDEFKGALQVPQYSGILVGSRFNDLATVIEVLESNVQEKTFLLNPAQFIDSVLIGAAQADHWYKYDKEY
jgi:hypothetical protein